jgi:hypothetical protein
MLAVARWRLRPALPAGIGGTRASRRRYNQRARGAQGHAHRLAARQPWRQLDQGTGYQRPDPIRLIRLSPVRQAGDERGLTRW